MTLIISYPQLARLILSGETKGQSLIMSGGAFNKLKRAYIEEKALQKATNR